MVIKESVVKGFRLVYTNSIDDDLEEKTYTNSLNMETIWKALDKLGVYERNDVYCIDKGAVKREFIKGKKGVWNLILDSGDGFGLAELSQKLGLRFPDEPVKIRVY